MYLPALWRLLLTRHRVTEEIASRRASQMTALNLASIPSAINSYERLAFWAIQCLQNTSNGEEINAVLGEGSVPIAQAQISKTADGRDRAILVAYVPIDYAALNDPAAKTWMAAQDISTADPATVFLSN